MRNGRHFPRDLVALRLQGFSLGLFIYSLCGGNDRFKTPLLDWSLHESIAQRNCRDLHTRAIPTRHADVRPSSLRDVGSRGHDWSLRPGVARAMRPDSESRCRVADGLVDKFGHPTRIRPVAAKTGSP